MVNDYFEDQLTSQHSYFGTWIILALGQHFEDQPTFCIKLHLGIHFSGNMKICIYVRHILLLLCMYYHMIYYIYCIVDWFNHVHFKANKEKTTINFVLGSNFFRFFRIWILF